MIRKAIPNDAKEIAILMIAAMGDLANKFRASDNNEEISSLFEHFISLTANQYSYQNCLVKVINEKVVGAVNAYDGGLIKQLRSPFLSYLNENFHNQPFEIEDETEAGEFYIDTLSVNPNYQIKGIGRDLLCAAINWAKELGHQKIGLLVNFDNPEAKKLYLNIGFKAIDVKILKGKKHDHLVYKLP